MRGNEEALVGVQHRRHTERISTPRNQRAHFSYLGFSCSTNNNYWTHSPLVFHFLYPVKAFSKKNFNFFFFKIYALPLAHHPLFTIGEHLEYQYWAIIAENILHQLTGHAPGSLLWVSNHPFSGLKGNQKIEAAFQGQEHFLKLNLMRPLAEKTLMKSPCLQNRNILAMGSARVTHVLGATLWITCVATNSDAEVSGRKHLFFWHHIYWSYLKRWDGPRSNSYSCEWCISSKWNVFIWSILGNDLFSSSFLLDK